MTGEYNEQEVDMAPREVRVGLKTPGQKMIRLVWAIEGLKSTNEVVEKSRDLGQVYDDGPSVALEAAAIALGEVPDQGAAFGPAVRDPADRPPPGKVFESILTDIRDFLKLRFKVEGMPDPDGTLGRRILSELRSESVHRELTPDKPEMTIQYAISALDALSQDREEDTNIGAACLILSDLLSAASEAA